MASTGIIENQFIETELNVSAKRTENLFRILFMIMATLFKSMRDSLLVLLVMPLALAGGLASGS